MNREYLNFYLQQADSGSVVTLSKKIRAEHAVQVIQKPIAQTLLLPVHDPVVSGRFYGGEILVTSAIVKVNDCKGWAMGMDSEEDIVCHIAILDGAWAADIERLAIGMLAEQGQKSHQKDCRQEAAQVDTTRVAFDLM